MALGHDLRPERPLDAPTPRSSRSPGEVQAALPADTPLPDRLRVAVAALRPATRCATTGGSRRWPRARARSSPPWSRRCHRSTRATRRRRPGRSRDGSGRASRRSNRRPRRVRALDRALSLLADHELATSTLGGARRRVDLGRSLPAAPHRARDRRRTAARRRVGVRAHACSATRWRPTPETADRAARCATASTCPGSVTRSTTGPDPRAPVLLDAVERCQPPARRCGAPRQGVLDVMARDGGPHPNIDFALGVLARGDAHGARRRRGDLRHRPQRGLDRARPRGVPAPAALPDPRHLHRPDVEVRRRRDARRATDSLGQPARRCWRRWSRKSTST